MSSELFRISVGMLNVCAERAVCRGYVVFVAHVGTAAPFERVFGDRVGIFVNCKFDVDASVCMCPIDVRREGDGRAIAVDDGDLVPVGIQEEAHEHVVRGQRGWVSIRGLPVFRWTVDHPVSACEPSFGIEVWVREFDQVRLLCLDTRPLECVVSWCEFGDLICGI